MGAAYENIKLDLRRKILGKTWLAGAKIPSSRELAAQYNCSTNTIEKCLRDLQTEGFLVRETRRGTFVSENAFPPPPEGVRIISDTVAVVVDDVNSYIFAKAFRGIEDVLKRRGFGLTISSHDNDPGLQESILQGLIQQGVRGVILYPALAFEEVRVGVPTVALCHNPDAAPQIARLGADWVLAGHTHGSELSDGPLGDLVLPADNRGYSAGYYALEDSKHLYVNRGLGYGRRKNINARPEVTVFTLCKAG